MLLAEIAQLVEHNLAKVGVASSSLVFRSEDARMVESVDTRDLKSLGHCGCAGSSPAPSTDVYRWLHEVQLAFFVFVQTASRRGVPGGSPRLDAFMDSGVFSLYPFLSRTPEIPSQTSEILSATWVCTKSDIETPECDLASPESCLVVRVHRLRFRRPTVRRAFPSPALRFLSPCGRKCPGP